MVWNRKGSRKVNQHSDLLAAAIDAAQAGAAFVRRAQHPGDTTLWGLKGRSDFVTQVDRESESVIADRLTRAFPGSVVRTPENSSGSSIPWTAPPTTSTTIPRME
jgi:fructose-1,6-bisphosphatase/inositol monophosphatase family enzyme